MTAVATGAPFSHRGELAAPEGKGTLPTYTSLAKSSTDNAERLVRVVACGLRPGSLLGVGTWIEPVPA